MLAILKLGPNFFSHFITPSHSLSHLITPYPLGWKRNIFNLVMLKLVLRPQFFYLILSRLVTPYHLEQKQNHFHLSTLKLVPRPLISHHILSHLVTHYHILSHLIPQDLKQNHFHSATLKLVPRSLISLSHLIMSRHSLSRFMTLYSLG